VRSTSPFHTYSGVQVPTIAGKGHSRIYFMLRGKLMMTKKVYFSGLIAQSNSMMICERMLLSVL
jgi:hypothetical protein